MTDSADDTPNEILAAARDAKAAAEGAARRRGWSLAQIGLAAGVGSAAIAAAVLFAGRRRDQR